METGAGSSSLTNRSTALFATVLGAMAGASGAIHGIYEMMKGNAPTGGFVMTRIGAVSLVQNYLATGILATLLGLAVAAWAIAFVGKRRGPTVFLALSVLLFLFGGGVAQVPGFLLTWAVSTRIRRRLSWWESAVPASTRKALASMWRMVFPAGFMVFMSGYSIWLFVLPPGETRVISPLHYVCWISLGIGFLLLLLAVPCAFSKDLELARHGGRG